MVCSILVDCRYFGLPVYYYQDNGKDYCAKKLQGLPNSEKEPLYLNKAFGESGLLEWMGVRTIRALPYRGCSKTIERIWRTIESEWISDLPGYCGGDASKRPVTLEEDRKHGKLYTSTVHRQGIFYNNQKYWCSALAPFVETKEKVRIFAFDAPFNRTLVVTLGKVTLGEAHLINNLDLVEQLRYKVIQHVMEQNEHLKNCSKHIKLVHNLVLQTNILKEALQLPAIDAYEDHTAYVQQIDHERDQKEAVDDPRIPDGMKDLALNYLDNLLRTEDEADRPGAATQFFQTLAARSKI